MTKITLTDLVNLQNETTAVNAINTNNAALRTASDNTLSRDGTAPNTMLAAIDMNSNQIYNLPAPSTVTSPARLIDVTTNPTITVPGTGTSGHTVPFLDGNNTWSGTNTIPSPTITGHATIEGQVLSGVTGTGNLVLKTSPTITTPTLAFGTGASSTISATSVNTGFTNSLNIANAGNAASSATFASSTVILSGGTNAYLQSYMQGGTPTAFITTGAGTTGGLQLSTSAGPLTLISPTLSGTTTATTLNVTTLTPTSVTSVASPGLIKSSSATAGVGYATGAGGTASQATSKSTGVTLNNICGQITMNGAALASATIVSFTLTNSSIAATDVIILNHQAVGTVGAYTLNAQCGSGSAVINVRNNTGGSLSEAIVLNYVVIKGVAS